MFTFISQKCCSIEESKRVLLPRHFLYYKDRDPCSIVKNSGQYCTYRKPKKYPPLFPQSSDVYVLQCQYFSLTMLPSKLVKTSRSRSAGCKEISCLQLWTTSVHNLANDQMAMQSKSLSHTAGKTLKLWPKFLTWCNIKNHQLKLDSSFKRVKEKKPYNWLQSIFC